MWCAANRALHDRRAVPVEPENEGRRLPAGSEFPVYNHRS
ncbi:hypothetical protein Dret_0230 [Desulfohalobium retbaense DSM 5692]|uniref:Uncharacterized protein n=1 Tax=Desulfohalobium retbaense (strain ATCC 49708 / DSM 5692 / JCM 16813 / HR100) TaxID=485915 RepID=C8WZQ7_DESRD|nr:hypothetical protein Dret_0230 [Desulfohalobium retbaense DSM 5692]